MSAGIKLSFKIIYLATFIFRWPRYLNHPLMAMKAQMEF